MTNNSDILFNEALVSCDQHKRNRATPVDKLDHLRQAMAWFNVQTKETQQVLSTNGNLRSATDIRDFYWAN